jgi:predicted DNA-binding transcriptional regulator AlpA
MVATKRFINEREFEATYGIKAATLRRWRLVGKGPIFRKLGGAVRYEVSAIEAWIAGCPKGGGERTEAR